MASGGSAAEQRPEFTPFSSITSSAHASRERQYLNTPIIKEADQKKLSVLGIIVGAALLAAVPFSLQFSQKSVVVSVDSADARVGRPLTPGSVAGVNRRVHRRAYRRAYYY